MATQEEILDSIANLSVLELSELLTAFEEKFGVTADRVAEVARKVVRDGLHGRIPTLDGGHFGGQGGHPTLAAGESGVSRTSASDPGHS